jgi:hypothetical protein
MKLRGRIDDSPHLSRGAYRNQARRAESFLVASREVIAQHGLNDLAGDRVLGTSEEICR